MVATLRVFVTLLLLVSWPVVALIGHYADSTAMEAGAAILPFLALAIVPAKESRTASVRR